MRNAGFSAYRITKSAAFGIVTLSILSAFPAQAITFKSQTPDTPPESSDNAAQPPEDTTPVIIPTGPTTSQFMLHNGDRAPEVAANVSSTVSTTLNDLQTNLGILYNLNSPANRETLDELGRSYGNVPLGSDLDSAISSINTSQIGKDGADLSRNVKTQMADFDQVGQSLKAHLLDRDFARNPKGIEGYGSLMGQFKYLIKFNDGVNQLNAHIVSLNNTYINLLTLSKQPPSTLIGIPELGNKLASLDGLATGQLKNLSQIGDILGGLSSGYNNLKDTGGYKNVLNPDGKASAAVNSINDSLKDAASQLEDANTEFSGVLGSVPLPFNLPAGTIQPGGALPPGSMPHTRDAAPAVAPSATNSGAADAGASRGNATNSR